MRLAAIWDSLLIGAAGSILAAIVIGVVVLWHKRGFVPVFDSLRAFLRLYWCLSSIRMTRFTRSREDYKRHRKKGSTVAKYACSAKSSLKIVSFSLITGIQIEGEFAVALRDLFEKNSSIRVDISLLDPRKDELVQAIAPSYALSTEAFRGAVHAAIDQLFELRRNLRPDSAARLRIRVHRAIPFGSAILIDTENPDGRIQIETKGYKSGLDSSWGFELRAGGRHPLYKTLVRAYEDLMNDGEELLEPIYHYR